MYEILDKILSYKARTEFCQIFRLFFGQWSFKKKWFLRFTDLQNAASEKISTHCAQCISGPICQRTQTTNKQRTLIYNRRVFKFQFVLNCVWTDDFILKYQQARKRYFLNQKLEICRQNLTEIALKNNSLYPHYRLL